jgi:simple sugar transport system ATP-binding protein
VHPPKRGAPRLAVTGLSLAADAHFRTALHDVRFELAAGEILGIAGVAGNGQKELLAALSGERLAAAAEAIRLDGKAVGRLGPSARRRLGVAFIPDERLGRGAVAEMALDENALLTAYPKGYVRAGLLLCRRIARFAEAIIGRYNVVAAAVATEARSLSGGNMQKFIVGREIGLAPCVLLAAHPTWGVDIGATLAVRQALIDLADSGVGVLVVSEDLAELFEIADRIAVLYAGRLSAAVATTETTVETVGELMGGLAAAPTSGDFVDAD